MTSVLATARLAALPADATAADKAAAKLEPKPGFVWLPATQRWRYRVTANGVRHDSVAATRQEALAKHAVWLQGLTETAKIAAAPMTFGRWLDTWLGTMTGPRSPLKVATRQRYETQTRVHLRTVLSGGLLDIRLSDLKPAHFNGALDEWAARGVGLATQRLLIKQCITVLWAAKHQDLVTENAASHKLVVLPVPPTKQRFEFDDARLPRLLAAAEQLPLGAALSPEFSRARLCALILVAAMGGLRRGEACGLQWANIRAAKEGMVRLDIVRHSSRVGVKFGGNVVEVGTKVAAVKSRVVFAKPVVREALERLRAANEAAGFGTAPEDWVFRNTDGSHLGPAVVTDSAKWAIRRAGLPESLTYHSLRHDFAAYLNQGNVASAAAAAIMGHSQKMLEDTYQFAGEQSAEAAMLQC
jgi:integrase